MANENDPNVDGSGGTGDSQDDGKVTLDRTELEQLKAKAAFHDKVTETAKEFDLETADDYLDLIEANASRATSEQLAQKGGRQEAKPDAVKPNANQPDPGAEQSRLMAAQATLTAHWTEFKVDESQKPAEERTTYSKAELSKLITGAEGQLVAKLAHSRFDGNLFAAANYLKTNTDPDRIAKARKAGADSEAAKAAAKDSANLGTSGRTQEPNDSTAAERATVEAEKRRTSIAPKDNYVYPG